MSIGPALNLIGETPMVRERRPGPSVQVLGFDGVAVAWPSRWALTQSQCPPKASKKCMQRLERVDLR
jgi:hypothetical protein